MYPAENQVYPLIAEAAASCDTKLNLPADEIQGQEQMVSLSLDFPFSSPFPQQDTGGRSYVKSLG